jgi:hypothetical protein
LNLLLCVMGLYAVSGTIFAAACFCAPVVD